MTVDPAPATAVDDPTSGRAQWSRRRKLERRLHDGAALRISALTLQLGLFRHRLPAGEIELDREIDVLQEELHVVLQELREVAAELYPPLLDEAGLGPALHEMSGGLDGTVTVDVPDRRFGAAAEGAAYFALLACLAGRPAGAGPVAVSARPDGADLLLRAEGADPRASVHFEEFAHPLGGSVDVSPGPRPGTATITARFPCA